MPIIQVVSKSIWPKMEEPNKAVVNSKAKEILVKTISIIIEFGCFLFVFIQTYQCIKKFIDDPQGTEIRIVKGYNITYPDITICPIMLSSNPYEPILQKCNLTYNLYFINGKWVGNGTEEFCTDPGKLFEKMTENAFDDLTLTFTDFNNNDYVDWKFKTKDYAEFGRCRSFKYPKDFQSSIATMTLNTIETSYQIFLSTPGYFLSPEYHSVLLEPDYDATVKVAREVIEVLDYEGIECLKTLKRDDCIYDYVQKVR